MHYEAGLCGLVTATIDITQNNASFRSKTICQIIPAIDLHLYKQIPLNYGAMNDNRLG